MDGFEQHQLATARKRLNDALDALHLPPHQQMAILGAAQMLAKATAAAAIASFVDARTAGVIGPGPN